MLLIVAIVVSEEFQVTDVVKSCVLLSEKRPVAVNGRVVPRNKSAEAGEISIDSSTACVTVSVVDPEMLPEVAVIVVEPVSTDVASPFGPDILLMVAILVFDEFQITDEEEKIFIELPSRKLKIEVKEFVIAMEKLEIIKYKIG